MPEFLRQVFDGDIVDGKYQINVGDGIYRIYQEIQKEEDFAIYRANPFPPHTDTTITQVAVKVFLPGLNQKENYEKEVHILERLDGARDVEETTPTRLLEHDSKSFAIVERLFPADTVTMEQLMRDYRRNNNPTEEFVKEASEMIRQVSRGFYEVTGYIHGDLRLSNILRRKRGLCCSH